MSPLMLLPWAGTATTLARGAAQALGESLSFAATLGNFGASTETEAAAENAAQLADQERGFHLAAEKFRELLQRALSAAGVDLTVPLEIKSDGLGGIQAAGDHPDRRLIEQVLSGDTSLQQQFQSLANDYAKLHSEFDLRHDDFGLLIADGQAHVAVEMH